MSEEETEIKPPGENWEQTAVHPPTPLTAEDLPKPKKRWRFRGYYWEDRIFWICIKVIILGTVLVLDIFILLAVKDALGV